MSIAECYSITVQCDGKHELGPRQGDFTGDSKRAAHAELRRAGWKLGPNFTAYCPACVKKRGEDALVRDALSQGRF